jgi:cysteine-rich secretory family protein
MTCAASGAAFEPCACGMTGTGGAVAIGSGGANAAATAGSGNMPGSGGMMGSTGSGGTFGSGTAAGGSGGVSAGTQTGSGGVMSSGSGGAASSGTGGVMSSGTGGTMSGSGGTSSNGDDEFDSVRQFCVDYINMYRATMNLPALERETHDRELCSDMGAKEDSDANRAHGSAGMCFMDAPYYGAGQNTCPSLPVGGFGAATLQDALKQCIDQMWAEGPPPSGTTVQQCIDDHAGCFQMHGHWINMIQTMYKSVSCGFYMKADGSYWANQDFPIKL